MRGPPFEWLVLNDHAERSARLSIGSQHSSKKSMALDDDHKGGLHGFHAGGLSAGAYTRPLLAQRIIFLWETEGGFCSVSKSSMGNNSSQTQHKTSH